MSITFSDKYNLVRHFTKVRLKSDTSTQFLVQVSNSRFFGWETVSKGTLSEASARALADQLLNTGYYIRSGYLVGAPGHEPSKTINVTALRTDIEPVRVGP